MPVAQQKIDREGAAVLNISASVTPDLWHQRRGTRTRSLSSLAAVARVNFALCSYYFGTVFKLDPRRWRIRTARMQGSSGTVPSLEYLADRAGNGYVAVPVELEMTQC